ncbi:MAG: hypothetical protein L6R39_000609 [Caloplaca ligustica]|nr:MAG: hypothetical protein L6R39_000609 [Caloplaca ligustica]
MPEGVLVRRELAFNKGFGMIRSGEQHFAVELPEKALGVQGFKLPTWIFRVLVAIPSLTRQYWRFIQYCNEQLAAKMAPRDFEFRKAQSHERAASSSKATALAARSQGPPERLQKLL